MKKLILGILMVSGLACSSKLVKTDELKTVRSVAVIGFDLQQQRSVSGMDLLAVATRSAGTPGAAPASAKEEPRAEQSYRDFTGSLVAKTGWKVMSIDQLRGHGAYLAYVKSKTEGLQSRPMINERFDLIRPHGVVDQFAVLTTEKDELIRLAKALGVDAVVTVSTTVELNNNSMLASMVGKGEYKPSGRTTILVKDGRSGESLLQLAGSGPQVQNGAKNTLGVSDEENLNRLALDATKKSIETVYQDFPVIR